MLIAGLWLLSDAFRGIFDSWLWPVLGLVFLPTTLLWYAAVQRWWSGEWAPIPVVGLAIALLIDLSPARGRRER